MNLELEYILHLTQTDVTHILLDAGALDLDDDETPALVKMLGLLGVS